MRKRDLYLTTYAPMLGSGRAMRTYTCVKALAMLGPVDLAYVSYGAQEPCAAYQAIENLHFHEIKPTRGARRMMTYLAKRLQGVPSVCCRGTSPELIALSQALAIAPERGRVIVGDGNCATALMSLARRRPIIYNAHNIESEYTPGIPGYRDLSRMLMRRYERQLITRAAESWMVSQADIQSARWLVPGARLRYVPNVVDVTAIKPVQSDRGRTTRMLMVADFTYQPNRSGRDFLLERVMPLVWRSLPEASLTLVGAGLEHWQAPDRRVQIAGFLEHLAPAYAACDCVVVPLTEGAGTPLKFVEALAYRVPVVATPKAARGLNVTANVHYREGATATEFAAGILDVLSAGADEMAHEGRRLAEREYSIQTLAECLAPSSLPA